MVRLVKDYYRGLQKGKTSKKKQRSEEKMIDQIVVNNFQHGDRMHMRDNYLATQVGTQGPNSGSGSTISQQYNQASGDYTELLLELEKIRIYLKKNDNEMEEYDIILGDVAKARKAISENNAHTAIQILKSAGSQLYTIARTIGCSLVASIIKNKMGI